MSSLPSGWTIVPLSEVVRIANGQVDPKRGDYKDLPHVGPENIESGTGRIHGVRTSKELGLKSGKYLFDEDAIVYSKIRPNLNKVCRPGFVGLCSADAYPMWPVNGISPDFLCYYMLSNMFVKQAVACSMRTGMPKINRDDLNTLWVICPSEAEQVAISSILASWDRTIELTERLIAEKLLYRKGLMQQLLTGKRRLPGFGKPVCGNQVPEGWKRLKTEEVFQNVSSKNCHGEIVLSVTQNEGIVLRANLDRKINMDHENTHTYKLVEPGDFVISLRSFQGGLEYSRFRGLVSPAYHVIRTKVKVSDDFYRHYFKSPEFIQRLKIATIGIRDGKQIRYDDFSFMRLPFPPVEEQCAIAKLIDAADIELKLLQDKLTALREQKKGLMQKLLTGKVRVKIEEENQ
ncbi:MAG: restriction endonuclease subunit S [Lascolabacillus sp.]|nr:restriction endonuclease subunit S [Lascolabacillus sp.]